MIRAHIQYMMVLMSIEYVEKHDFKDKMLRPLLHKLIQIFAIKQLINDTGLYACGYFDKHS